MKKLVLFISVIFSGYFLFSQPYNYPVDIQSIATLKGRGAIVEILPDFQIPASSFFEKYQHLFGLKDDNEMRLSQTTNGRGGIEHYRFQQYYKGIFVDGAQLILHEKNGQTYRVTGKIVNNISLSTTPTFSGKKAIEIAIKNSSGTHFGWENASLEKDLQTIRKDSTATYYPTPELIIYDTKASFNSKNYHLVYKISLFVISPDFYNEIFYIDASNGKIIKQTKKRTSVDIEVSAVTRYNGTQTITVDSLTPNLFMLRSNARENGFGIWTKNMNNEGGLTIIPTENATDIFENDSFFDSDIIANSAHFGAEMTYDYYFYKHGRNSFDDMGTQLLSYVHTGQNMQNAFWNGSAMFYGDGINNYPYTFLSVCGHEITHGVTEYTANLEYFSESGALNESFSDIFGVMIHYYATDSLQWTIGEELNSPFRDMSNPKRFQNPDTYLGNYWVSSNEDYGGVHTNCGVGNYWFYLLCMGGEGINDYETPYHVTGITPEKSEIIAYELLTQYLTQYSDYHEAYTYSLAVAEDLYGNCSPEKLAVAAAWAAVGIGYPYNDSVVHITSVLTPVTSCALQNDELINLQLLYNSCNDTLRAGTPIFFKIRINDATDILDTLFLTQDLAPGLFNVTLNKSFDFSVIGDYQLDFEIGVYNDTYTSSLKNYTFTNRTYQNSDIGVAEILSPQSSCFLDEHSPITVKIFFDVCDQTQIGDKVVVSYTINGLNKTTDTLVLTQTMTAQDTLLHTFTVGGDFTIKNRNVIRAFTESPEDMNTANNSASKTIYKPKYLNQISNLTFDNSGNDEYFYTEVNEYSNAYTYLLPNYANQKILKMTAKGDPMSYMSEIDFVPGEDLWEFNKKMDSKAIFCINAEGYQELALAFDLKQTSGKNTYAMFLGDELPDDFDLRYSSMMRLLVDSTVVTETFIPNNPTNDPFEQKVIDLTAYAGEIFQLTIQAKCLVADMNLFAQTYILDNVYIDNMALWNSVGIAHKNNANFNIDLYPNPNHGSFTVSLQSIGNQDFTFTLTDITGKLVFQETHSLNGTPQQIPINVQGLKSGFYLLSVRSNNEQMVKKVVIN